MGNITDQYLAILEQQREEMFQTLEKVDENLIWQRPKPGKWSIGEQIDHLRAITKFMRRFIAVLWPLLFLMGWIRRNKSYDAEMDDVYERPGFPMNVGWLWPPKYKPENPVSVAVLKQALGEEHDNVKSFYRNKPEHILGNALVYDPAIGWLNMLQVLRVGIHHDAHHYKVIKGILESLEKPESEGS
ncbi:DinB family protein [Dethiobacter alkaliphilus]|uniref:DinB-like domain-containing protein n=1 Tax=Dethiobacter alkaliphilus AHT 1 TaxID=555088 RepID=C0GKB8_DETAL|nr:DinB family protein [Dethiobacter alkaliphilus]EEG76233.1 hypothetical protein DealDRAFT_2927 [Dethiobacter alkaliphilus AHT 1]